MKKSILVVAAHADDMEISMGGTCLKYQKAGYEFHVVYSTNNMSGGNYRRDETGKPVSYEPEAYDEMQVRKSEAAQAAKIFNTVPVHLDFPQRHFIDKSGRKIELCYASGKPDFVPENIPTVLTAHEHKDTVRDLAAKILEWDPEVIITMGPADPNLEHIATGYLAMKAMREAQKSGYDGTLLFCMTPAPSGIAPLYDAFDVFVDTTGFMQAKYDAIRVHASQKPWPERLDMRDHSVGARFGCETAEPFILAHTSEVRTGPLTVEIQKNHARCIRDFQQFFYR